MHAFIDVPGGVRTLMTSAYLKCVAGFDETNCDLLQQVGDACDQWSGPFLLGADFNNSPKQLEDTGFADRLNAKIIAQCCSN